MLMLLRCSPTLTHAEGRLPLLSIMGARCFDVLAVLCIPEVFSSPAVLQCSLEHSQPCTLVLLPGFFFKKEQVNWSLIHPLAPDSCICSSVRFFRPHYVYSQGFMQYCREVRKDFPLETSVTNRDS